MASNIRDLRRRIRSVRNTSQLTRAMKMVSAAKLRRAQEAMLGARPYSHSLERVLTDVAQRTRPELHPLLVTRDPKKVDIVIIAGDKGLCGSFNAAVLRAGDSAIREQKGSGRDVKLVVVGKKGVEYYRRRDTPIVEAHGDVFRTFEYSTAAQIARNVQERYVSADCDAVYLVYNEFKSAISQRLIVKPLLPIGGFSAAEGDEKVEYIYEPDAAKLMELLLPRYVAFELYHAMLESIAAEHAARMTAMEAATRNAEEMIDKLTLVMNRARQAAITTEIIEVVSGAEALG